MSKNSTPAESRFFGKFENIDKQKETAASHVAFVSHVTCHVNNELGHVIHQAVAFIIIRIIPSRKIRVITD